MKIYINNKTNDSWVLLRHEVLPNNTPTLDETLETFSFALISNKDPIPFAPMQKVKVDFLGDETEIDYFYIVSDSVETYSLNPLRYKHSISCIQNTRALSKHLVRNSAFTQPGYLTKSAFNAESARPTNNTIYEGQAVQWSVIDQPSLNWASEKLTLTNHEKVKSAKFNISFQWFRQESSSQVSRKTLYSDAHTTDDIVAHAECYDSFVFNDSFTLYYEDANGNPHTEAITAATFGVSKIDLNSSYEFPRIVELAKQGCNNFEIRFNSAYVFSAVYAQNPVDYFNVQYWQMQLEIVAEVYWWNCYEILDLLLKRQQKRSNYHYYASRLFSLPESGDLYNLLNNTIAPNFTFTQLTLYECVADVFRVFDAIFTMDENGVLGIEYFNDLDKEHFTNSNIKLTGRNLSLGEDKYTDGLVAYYQDARTEESYPKDGSFAPLRSAEFGVPARSDHNFIVPHSIDSIIKCEVILPEITYNETVFCYGNIIIDITRFVLEQNVWSMLNKGSITSDDYAGRIVKQSNSIFYVKGDNKIQVAFSYKNEWNITHYSLFNALAMALVRMSGYQTGGWKPTSDYRSEDWSLFKMRLTYITSVDGKVEIHSLVNKFEGETLIDQANGAVDLNKLGLNMLGLSMKLGNPTLNATHKITSWSKRIRKGQIYEWTINDKKTLWVANVVNYTFINGRLQGKISFVQNFNQLALRTQLLREKRMTNISKELVLKSEEILTDYVYYSSEYYDDYTSSSTYFDRSQLAYFIRDSFNIVGPRSKVDDFFLYDDEEIDPITGEVLGVYIPSVRYGAGNTINFEMSFFLFFKLLIYCQLI